MAERSYFEAVYRSGVEAAEMEFLRARERGMAEPVVELRAADAANPRRVDIHVVERRDLVASLRGRCDGAAEAIRGVSRPAPFLLLVTLPEAAPVVYRPIPVE